MFYGFFLLFKNIVNYNTVLGILLDNFNIITTLYTNVKVGGEILKDVYTKDYWTEDELEIDEEYYSQENTVYLKH
jgi:hypothetical protein